MHYVPTDFMKVDTTFTALGRTGRTKRHGVAYTLVTTITEGGSWMKSPVTCGWRWCG